MVGDPALSGLSAGTCFDAVIHVQSCDLHGAHMIAVWQREQCRCQGAFEADRVYTLYGVQYQGFIGDMHHLRLLEGTKTVLIAYCRVIPLC